MPPRASFAWWTTKSRCSSSTRSPAGTFGTCWPICNATAALGDKCACSSTESPDSTSSPIHRSSRLLPEDREGIFRIRNHHSGVTSIPADLGETRMKLISEWVEQSNGGIIFLAGPKFDPTAYGGNPSRSAPPAVVADTAASGQQRAERFKDPVQLKLTSIGETSPYLQACRGSCGKCADLGGIPRRALGGAGNQGEAGCRSAAGGPDSGTGWRGRRHAGDCRPGIWRRAQRLHRHGRNLPLAQPHRGKVLLAGLGCDHAILVAETPRGASSRTQLKADRERYFVGDKVTIAGKIYKEGYEPITVGTLQGKLKIASVDAKNAPVEKVQPMDVDAFGDQPGEYRGQFTADVPGTYSYSTLDDPGAAVKFEGIEPKIEQMETALNERTLRPWRMWPRDGSSGKRTWKNCPTWFRSKAPPWRPFAKLTCSIRRGGWRPLLVLFLEWLLRRLMQLK